MAHEGGSWHLKALIMLARRRIVAVSQAVPPAGSLDQRIFRGSQSRSSPRDDENPLRSCLPRLVVPPPRQATRRHGEAAASNRADDDARALCWSRPCAPPSRRTIEVHFLQRFISCRGAPTGCAWTLLPRTRQFVAEPLANSFVTGTARTAVINKPGVFHGANTSAMIFASTIEHLAASTVEHLAASDSCRDDSKVLKEQGEQPQDEEDDYSFQYTFNDTVA